MVKVEDSSFLDTLYKGSALTFMGASPTDKVLKALYKWFKKHGYLSDEIISLYAI